MVDLLVLLKIVKKLILVRLVIDISKPCYAKYGALSLFELVMFKGKLNKVSVALNHFKEQVILNSLLVSAVETKLGVVWPSTRLLLFLVEVRKERHVILVCLRVGDK